MSKIVFYFLSVYHHMEYSSAKDWEVKLPIFLLAEHISTDVELEVD
jgi:hypothetical protein